MTQRNASHDEVNFNDGRGNQSTISVGPHRQSVVINASQHRTNEIRRIEHLSFDEGIRSKTSGVPGLSCRITSESKIRMMARSAYEFKQEAVTWKDPHRSEPEKRHTKELSIQMSTSFFRAQTRKRYYGRNEIKSHESAHRSLAQCVRLKLDYKRYDENTTSCVKEKQ